MPVPFQPVTLSAQEVGELRQKLVDLRHDVNNKVSLMLASLEMMRHRPETRDSMFDSFSRQPKQILDAVAQFSKDLESALGITK
jgi:hypothetical protein